MHATVRSLIELASNAGDDVCILDTEASPEHLSRGTAKYADVMLVVVESYFKSLETGRRMAVLAKDLKVERVALIANKIQHERELEAVREFVRAHELELLGSVPYDDLLPEAERERVSPLDYAGEGPAVAAIGKLAERLVSDGRA